MTPGRASPLPGGPGWSAYGYWKQEKVLHVTGNRISPEADLVHQLLYLSGHVSDLVSCWLLNKSFSLLNEETEDEAESVVKSLHVEDLLGDQDVLEAPVLVLGRLDVEVPGLARGLNHLNRK